MGWFITSIIVGLVAVIAVGIAVYFNKGANDESSGEYERDGAKLGRTIAGWVGAAFAVLTVVFFFLSALVSNGVGEAKVYTNPDGTVAFTQTAPGYQWKAPWQSYVEFDLFSQTIQFAGNGDAVPQYTGGSVSGYEVTAAVKGGAQSNFDLSVTYSLDADEVLDIYNEFKSQERFTQQVIVQQTLSTVRKIPSAYTPVEFRGEKAGEAADKMLTAVQDKLGKYGVDVTILNTQNVRYTDDVELSIQNVLTAQQKEEQAAAELRATQVSAQARVVEAQAEADANAILAQSLTPQILQARYIEALKAGTVYVVPDGSIPMVGTR